MSATFAPQWDEVVGYDPIAGKAYHGHLDSADVARDLLLIEAFEEQP